MTAGRGRIGLVPFSQTNSSTASLELTSSVAISLHQFRSKQFGGNESFLLVTDELMAYLLLAVKL